MLAIAKVTKRFHAAPYRPPGRTDRRYVLDSVTLDAGPGETVGVFAREGEGKTTLARIVCGFLSADRGTISAYGVNVKPGLYGITRSISGVIGGYTSFLERFTVDENIVYYCALHGMNSKAAATRVLDLVDLMGLAGIRLTQAVSLTRGQRKRLALAIALISDPQVLVIDEPVAGLQGMEVGSFVRLLRELLQKQSRTVLLLTGNQDVAADLCGRAFVLHGGKIVKQGRTEELFGDRAGIRYSVTVATGSPVIMDRFARDLEVCFPHAKVKLSEQRAIITLREADTRVVYALIDLAREHGLILVDVSRSRSGLWDEDYEGHPREGRKLWSF